MAVAFEPQDILFEALSNLYEADTGSGGLANTADTNAAYVARFIQDGDPNYDEDRAHNLRGQIVVSIAERDDAGLGVDADSTMLDLVVRMLVLTKRDKGRTNQHAINARVRSVFDYNTLSGTAGWRFSTLSRTGGRQLRPTAKLNRYVHEFYCRTLYDESVSTAPMIGRPVTLTFGSNLGVTSKMVANVVALQMSSPSRPVTLWGDTAVRATRRPQRVSMTAQFVVRSDWPELVAISQRSDVVTVGIGTPSFALTNVLIEDVRVRSVSNRAVSVELDLVGTAVGVQGSLITQ